MHTICTSYEPVDLKQLADPSLESVALTILEISEVNSSGK